MSIAFSDNAEKEFNDLVGRYPNTLAALLPALHLAQREFGWVSVDVMDYVAGRLSLEPAQVLTTATFYSMYNKAPVGKCHIQVCTTLSCAFRGGYQLIERLEERLGIRLGDTDSGYDFTLSEVECLASCGTAPMCQVTTSDGEMTYYENLASEDALDTMLSALNEKISDLPDPRTMQD